jgi:3-oxoacyl-[acyl-carrier-protein] synthase III
MGTALIETSPRAPAVKMPGVAGIASVAAVLPPDRVRNDEIAERIGVSPEWIVERTGIRERRKAAEGASLTELAAEAGRRALAAAGADPASVELVLVATLTPDSLLPNAAPLVAGALGIRGAAA